VADTRMPSLTSSPRILTQPHRRFSHPSLRIRPERTRLAMAGRPGLGLFGTSISYESARGAIAGESAG